MLVAEKGNGKSCSFCETEFVPIWAGHETSKGKRVSVYTPTLRELNADLHVANDVLPQDGHLDRPEKTLVYPSSCRLDQKEDQKEKKRKKNAKVFPAYSIHFCANTRDNRLWGSTCYRYLNPHRRFRGRHIRAISLFSSDGSKKHPLSVVPTDTSLPVWLEEKK